MFEVHLYIETDSRSLRSTQGCWGYVLEYKTPQDIVFTKCEVGSGMGTDKGLLLAAVVRACERIKKESHVTVHTSSQFLVNGFNKWMKDWKTNNWIAASGKEVKNRYQWQEIADNELIKKVSAVEDRDHTYSAWLQTEIKRANLGPGDRKEIKAE